MKSAEIVAELRRLGYTGPVSYGKAKLEQLLADAERRNGLTTEPVGEAAQQHAEAPAPPVPGGNPSVWCGLSKGAPVRIDGQGPLRFTFLSYETPDGKEPYVVVMGGKRNKVMMRYFRPEQVLHPKTRKPVMSDA